MFCKVSQTEENCMNRNQRTLAEFTNNLVAEGAEMEEVENLVFEEELSDVEEGEQPPPSPVLQEHLQPSSSISSCITQTTDESYTASQSS